MTSASTPCPPEPLAYRFRRIAVLAIVMSIALVVVARQVEEVGWCGHKFALIERYLPNLETHCCVAGEALSKLYLLAATQCRYRTRTHSWASSETDLIDAGLLSHRLGVDPQQGYAIEWVVEGDDWHAVISKTQSLPGHYLMTSNGALYFSEDHPATTSDIRLSEAWIHR